MTVACERPAEDVEPDAEADPCARLGWTVTRKPADPATSVAVDHERVRAVVAESLDPEVRRPLPHLHRQAASLLAHGASVLETVFRLSEPISLWAHQPGSGSVAVTVVDLRSDGRVEMASHCAPPVLRARAGHFTRLMPLTPTASLSPSPLGAGDHLILATGTFLGGLDARFLRQLPGLAAKLHPHPLHSLLLAAGDRASQGVGTGLLVVSRTALGSASDEPGSQADGGALEHDPTERETAA